LPGVCEQACASHSGFNSGAVSTCSLNPLPCDCTQQQCLV
jgi:hypothetical protein